MRFSTLLPYRTKRPVQPGPARRETAAPKPLPPFWRWYRDYWAGPGSEVSHSVCRIAVGLALLGILQGLTQANWAAYIGSVNRAYYRPIGILYLLGRGLPPAWFFAACQAVAGITVWCVIAGFLTRLSFVLCTLSTMALASLPWCFYHGWCHGQNVVLLAAIAMMFGGAGTISVDALLRRILWRTPDPSGAPPSVRWPVFLGQFTVATMFANAAFWKLNHPGSMPGVWAFSDNLRNILVMQYWALDQPLPWFVDFIVKHEWVYKGLALGNLINQCLPVLACFLVRRPVLRALLGLSFVVETFFIGRLMGLGSAYWYLLYAFFIDWDWVVARLRRGREEVRPEKLPAARRFVPVISPGARAPEGLETPYTRHRKPAFALAWVTLFVGVYVLAAFGSKKQHSYTYPFSAFPMYCEICAQKPYNEHRPYYLYGARWEIEADPPLPPEAFTWLQQSHYSLPWFSNFDRAFPDRVQHVTQQLEHLWGTSIRRLCLSKAVFQVPPFPDYTVRECQHGCTYLLDHGRPAFVGTECGWDETEQKFYVEVKHSGFDEPRFRVGYSLDYVEDFRELRGEWKDRRFLFDKTEPGAYLIGVWVRDDRSGKEERLYLGDYLRVPRGNRDAYAGTRPSRT